MGLCQCCVLLRAGQPRNLSSIPDRC